MDYYELAVTMFHNAYTFYSKNYEGTPSDSICGESQILLILLNQTTHIQPSEISTMMSISTARIARALNSLEKKGFVTRGIAPKDRRKILVDITAEGKDYILALKEKRIRRMQFLLEQLGEEDAREYARIYSKLVAIARKQASATE